MLALVIFMSYTTARLWFAGYDPYLTLFGLHWLFGAEASDYGIALLILGLVVAASLVVDRFWCRYLCPLGAALSVVGSPVRGALSVGTRVSLGMPNRIQKADLTGPVRREPASAGKEK